MRCLLEWLCVVVGNMELCWQEGLANGKRGQLSLDVLGMYRMYRMYLTCGFMFTFFMDWNPLTKVYTHNIHIGLVCYGKTWSSGYTYVTARITKI